MTEQLGVTLFKISFWIYLIAAFCYLNGLIKNQKIPAKLGQGFLLAAFAVHTASIAVISVAIGRLPLLNLYEYMLSFTWAAAAVYIVTERLIKNTALGAFCVPLITIFVFFAERLPNAHIDESVMPALRSAWRVPHIASGILAYGAFLIAFIVAVMYLLRERDDNQNAKRKKDPTSSWWAKRLPSAPVLDTIVYRTVAFGFLMQTLLVVIGAIWAQMAWGRYWGWDPKETWSFITWLIYATFLHTRTSMGWRGRKSALLAIFGFAATAFTLLGVSYLFHGLHSYANN